MYFNKPFPRAPSIRTNAFSWTSAQSFESARLHFWSLSAAVPVINNSDRSLKSLPISKLWSRAHTLDSAVYSFRISYEQPAFPRRHVTLFLRGKQQPYLTVTAASECLASRCLLPHSGKFISVAQSAPSRRGAAGRALGTPLANGLICGFD